MQRQTTYTGTLAHIYAHWPQYLFGYGGGALLLLVLMVLALQRGWWGFLLPAFAAVLLLGYFFVASLWAAYQQFDVPRERDYEVLFEMGRIQPTDQFVHISLGRQTMVRGLARRLTAGRITAIDVYNPLLAPGRALARQRQFAQQLLARQAARQPGARPDPRLVWLNGSIDLLPLPDNSVPLVTMSRVLSELWQHGDQLCLLQEIHRILLPGGRVLLAEPVRSETRLLLHGPAALRMNRPETWQTILRQAGFELVKEEDGRGLVMYWRVDKPHPGALRQLAFDFGL